MTTVLQDRLARLTEIELAHGAHENFDEGVCAVELVSWLADEPFSDHPKCVSPVVGAFLRSWNDSLDDEGRQKLKPYLARAIGTAGDGRDEERAWLVTDWLVRTCAPAWLELAGVRESPAALRVLPPIGGSAEAKSAQPTIDKARDAGDAARAAAGAAAWAAAGAAAWDAAWAAAGAAAWAAAWDAARAAAWAAAGAAAWAAADKKLAPTRVALQASAFDLLDRLVAEEPVTA